MRLGSVIKIDKRNKTTSETFDDDVLSGNFDVIVIFQIYDHVRAIRKPDSRLIVCKDFISLKSNL